VVEVLSKLRKNVQNTVKQKILRVLK